MNNYTCYIEVNSFYLLSFTLNKLELKMLGLGNGIYDKGDNNSKQQITIEFHSNSITF